MSYVQGLFFTTSIQHSHDLAEILRQEGVSAYPVSGETPKEERRRLIKLYKEGAIDGLCSCDALGEGTDLPTAVAGCMCRPTKSQLRYIQNIGRLLRKFPAPEGERTYQVDALDSLVEDYNTGLRNLLLVLATGTGKTRIASNIPKRFGLKTTHRLLFLVHRDELVFQAAEALAQMNPDRKVGIEKAEYRADDADLVVASVQSIGTGSKLDPEKNQWTITNKRLLAMNPDRFGVVVVDECHHCIGANYKSILAHMRVLKTAPPRNPHKLLIGLSATINRGDGIGLECVFDKISYEYGIRPAIKDGWLAPIQAFRVETETDISGVAINRGDFAVGQLEDAVNNPRRNLLVASKYKELCDRSRLGWLDGHKEAAIIIDFADLTAKHSVVTVPSLFNLRGNFDAKGGDLVDQAEEIEALEKANPGLDLRQCTDIEELRASLRRIDLLAPPIVPPEIKRISKFNWIMESEGAYHLVLPRMEMLSIRQNTLGDWEISKHCKGSRSLAYVAEDLEEALARADNMVEPEDRKLLWADAGWKRQCPKQGQCEYLYKLDKGLREDYRTPADFFRFATVRFEAGDLRYARGAISRMLDSKMAARH